jgi:hypothetical protein
MHDKEALEMMDRCLHELLVQRKQIDLLTPRADAYETISIIARGLAPRQSSAMGEDITWLLRKKIEELLPKPQPVKSDDDIPF